MRLPAGLNDKGVEFFVSNSVSLIKFDFEVKATYDGKIYNLMELPDEILDLIRHFLLKKPKAIKALADMGKTTDEEMLTTFIACNFGGYNNIPDISTQGEIKTEYWDCGHRGECPYEGKLCDGLKVKNGVLTSREIEIIKLIAQGYFDKEIAAKLGISVNTVPAHKANIQRKTGLKTKTEFAVMAYQKGIL